MQTNNEITSWLDSYNIKNYTLIEDPDYGFVVNVDGSVDLNSKNLDFIPVKFNIVKDVFDCSNNNLKSLDFSPVKVGEFWCGSNRISSLKNCPKEISESFYAGKNQLESLNHLPDTINGSKIFKVDNNPLLGELQSLNYFYEIPEIQKNKIKIKQMLSSVNKKNLYSREIIKNPSVISDLSFHRLLVNETCSQKGEIVLTDNERRKLSTLTINLIGSEKNKEKFPIGFVTDYNIFINEDVVSRLYVEDIKLGKEDIFNRVVLLQKIIQDLLKQTMNLSPLENKNKVKKLSINQLAELTENNLYIKYNLKEKQINALENYVKNGGFIKLPYLDNLYQQKEDNEKIIIKTTSLNALNGLIFLQNIPKLSQIFINEWETSVNDKNIIADKFGATIMQEIKNYNLSIHLKTWENIKETIDLKN